MANGGISVEVFYQAARQVILNASVVFLAHYRDRKTKGTRLQRKAIATGVTSCVQAEKEQLGEIRSIESRESGAYKHIDKIDGTAIKTAIKYNIYEFYTIRRQLPTLTSLLLALQSDLSRITLQESLRRLGYSWKTIKNNRIVLKENPDLVNLRLQYFQKKAKLECRGFELVYIDETWIHSAYCAKICQQGPTTEGVITRCNRGQRLIVLNAGNRNGFIPNACLIYKALATTGDYHGEMNGNNFTKWLTEMVLPNLNEPSAIVMDNASYHSMKLDKVPTTKDAIKDWLRKHNVAFEDNMLRRELLELARSHRPPPTYSIDELIRRHGHEVLRLPPYHPDLNAIEIIWSQLKKKITHRNVSFRLDDVQKLTTEAMSQIEADQWRAACDHVEKLEAEYSRTDHVVDDT